LYICGILIFYGEETMTKDDLTIRLESAHDFREVEHITREAFWNHYVPGCDEHYLAHILRGSSCFLPDLDFVAELDDKIIGNIMYTRAVVLCDDGEEYPALSFGPVSVLPDFQGMGVGSALIRHSLAAAKNLGHTAVLIYGDPDYYYRFGFLAAEIYGIGTADNFYAAALQAQELIPGALAGKTGRFRENEIYQIDARKAKKFDLQFTPKERITDLPSQKKFLQHVSMRKPRV
jgi:predicted N-acetyltransferase YhbS